MKKLFGLFFVICDCSSVFGMKVDERLLGYLEGNAIVCFHEKRIERKDISQKLNSSETGDTISCIKICGTMIRQSLFEHSDNFDKLKNVVSLLSDDGNKNYTGGVMRFAERVFARLSKDTSNSCLHKLAFFAPTATKSLDLPDWLARFNPFVANDQNNYMLSKWNQNYDLELALSILFTPVSFHFWDSNKNKIQYVQNMCGAIRTYLYYVEGKVIESHSSQRTPSSSIILRECYFFYKEKDRSLVEGTSISQKSHQD